MTLLANFSVKASDSPSIDAFGRWRTSEPYTIFDSKQIFDTAPLFWDDSEVSGSGTSSSYDGDKAMTQMGVSANTAGKRVRQTFMRFNYQPGKSQLCLLTFKASAIPSGVDICIGQFDDDNGIFLQALDGTVNLVIRSSTSGSAVDTAVAQSAWNGDKLDGTGLSGETLDMTKANIFWFDYEWLGVGRVRAGVVIDGAFIQAHEFNHANGVDQVYMSTPNLPLRYSIENDGTGAATTLDHICASVMSEGGNQDLGALRYASTGGTHVDCATENTIYAIVGLKLKATYVGATIKLTQATISEHTGSKLYEWMLILNPTVAGTFTYSNETNSAIMSAKGATANTVTGGTIICGGFESSTTKGGSSQHNLDNALRLGADIAGTVDEIVLCARPVGGSTNIDIEGSIGWREIS